MPRRYPLPPEVRGRIDDLLPTNVRDHLAYATARGFTARTLEARRDVLFRLHVDYGMADLEALTTQQLVEWLGRPGWSVQSRETYYGHLSAFYRWAHDMERIDRNPLAKVPRPRVPASKPRPLSADEFDKVMAVTVEPWRTAVLLAFYAGLRAGEIARLRREDVTVESIRVTGKGGRTDVLPTHPTLWEHLQDRPAGLLVARPDGQPFDGNDLSIHFATFMIRRMGMPRTGLHRLRHTYATKLLRSGANIRVVQTLMRHQNLATTARYTAVDEDERRHAIGAL